MWLHPNLILRGGGCRVVLIGGGVIRGGRPIGAWKILQGIRILPGLLLWLLLLRLPRLLLTRAVAVWIGRLIVGIIVIAWRCIARAIVIIWVSIIPVGIT